MLLAVPQQREQDCDLGAIWAQQTAGDAGIARLDDAQLDGNCVLGSDIPFEENVPPHDVKASLWKPRFQRARQSVVRAVVARVTVTTLRPRNATTSNN